MCQVIIEKNLSQNNKKYRGITKMNKTRREKRERGGNGVGKGQKIVIFM